MYTKECPICKRKFEGFTEKQVNHFIDIHMISKHRNLIEIHTVGEK